MAVAKPNSYLRTTPHTASRLHNILSQRPRYANNMYKPISCVRTGAQRSRFPRSSSPIVKHWRCDLTALSHVYNLYFVACNEEIYVYSPSFPSQNLGDPAQTFKVPKTGLPTPPGIDLEHAHSITRICVDYLGNTEVLLVTCDDGDVVVWRVGDINRAINSLEHSPGRDDEQDMEHHCLPLEHINVSRSAWGLAVHRNARLIAISANTHVVTVVAYGLSQPGDGKNEFAFPRNQNQTITLRAQTNIPAVSFDNTGGDPTGRWLASCSIDGLTHLWDLSRPNQPARVIAVRHCVSVSNVPDLRVLLGYTIEGPIIPKSCRCPNMNHVPHAAWAAIFIDPRSCRHVDSLADACGFQFDAQASVASRSSQFWDITDETYRFGSGRKKNTPGLHSGPSWATEETSLVPAVPAAEVVDTDQSGSSEGSGQTSIDLPSDNETIHTLAVVMVETVDQLVAQQEQFVEDEEEPDLNLFATPYSPAEDQITLPPPSPSPGPAASHEESQSGEEEGASISEAAVSSNRSKKPYCAFATSNHHKEYSAELPTHQQRPMVIVTKEEIYLFQHPLGPTTSPSFPILTMRNPLYPPQSYRHTIAVPVAIYHRQCFTAQIPELGVFIIGSPAGRVGIFRLTRTRYQTQHSEEIYGFRLDQLLPLSKDEAKYGILNQSGKQLIGVAVGPVQGMFDAEEAGEEERDVGMRRWRLMMYYHDHTVLAYELGKYGGAEDVRVDELVV
ncbi:hypothetical protein PMIN03_000139 [Paraphaeosphaeria minitans]